MEREREEQPHQPALDGLRGIAVIAVLVSHFSSLLPAGFGPPIFKAVLSCGWTGVDLFFALSGFLITRILLRTKGRPGYLTAFWVRRGLRILPLYFVTLIVVLVAGDQIAALHVVLPPAADRPLYFVFLTNWAVLRHSWNANMLGHLWSLGVEEQFYLVWPFCVLLLSRGGLRILTIALAVGALLLRVRYVAVFGPADLVSYLTVTRADSLALGALAATLASGKIAPGRVRVASVVAIAAFCAFCIGSIACWSHKLAFFQTIGFSLLAVAFAACVFCAAQTQSRTPFVRALEARWLMKWGKYSFGIYLFHVPILECFRFLVVARILPIWHANFVLVAAGIGALCAVTYYLAKLSFEIFETPILRLKRYARTGSALSVPAPSRSKALSAVPTESS